MELRSGETASDRDATPSLSLTDEELDELHLLLQGELLYGDDELVYMTSENGKLQNERLTSILRKVENEAKRRGRWWA